MQITMAYVASLNGNITKTDQANPAKWASAEDRATFHELVRQYPVIVMDRVTYQTIQPGPRDGVLQLVLTHHPENFAEQTVAGKLEFTNEAPATLVRRLSQTGFDALLMAGGSSLGTQFLAEGLVDDLYITYEPVIFAGGRPLPGNNLTHEVHFRLQEVRCLNERGTILAHYKVEK